MNRKTRISAVAIVALIAVLSGASPSVAQLKSAKVPFTISKETTYATAPVNADGTVNYSGAMNAILGKDLKPADNAAVPLAYFLRSELDQDVVKALVGGPEEGREPFLTIFQWAISVGRSRGDANEAMLQFERSLAKPWTAADFAVVLDYLKAMDKPIGEAIAASRRPRMLFPLLSSFGGTTLAETRMCSSFGRLNEIIAVLRSRATFAAAAGSAEETFANLAAIHRLARLMAQRGFLWDWNAARGIDEQAEDARLIALAQFPADALRKHLAELEAMGEFPSPQSAVNVGERLARLERVCYYAMEGVQSPSSPQPRKAELDWDAVLKATNDLFDQLSAALAQPTPASCDEAIARIAAAMKKELESAGLTNDAALGKVLDGLGKMSADEKARLSKCMACWEMPGWLHSVYAASPTVHGRQLAKERLTRVAVALAIQKAQKGEYPESLDALAPGILKKLPADPFTDKAFVYKRDGKGYVLYSVGPNQKDDGGQAALPRPPRRGPPIGTAPAANGPDDISIKAD